MPEDYSSTPLWFVDAIKIMKRSFIVSIKLSELSKSSLKHKTIWQTVTPSGVEGWINGKVSHGSTPLTMKLSKIELNEDVINYICHFDEWNEEKSPTLKWKFSPPTESWSKLQKESFWCYTILCFKRTFNSSFGLKQLLFSLTLMFYKFTWEHSQD